MFSLQDEDPFIPEDDKVLLLLASTLCLLVFILVLLALVVLVFKTSRCLRPASDKRKCPCKHCQHLGEEGRQREKKQDRIMAV